MTLLLFSSLKLFFLTLSALVPALLAVALFTIAERKILAGLQRRQGPTVVGVWGFLQVLADGFKLLLKSLKTMCSRRNKLLFVICPFVSFVLSFSMWSLIPFTSSHIISCVNYGLLWLLVLSSLKVYTIFFAGWSSNSKYPLLGGLRSVAQVISYEISLSFCFLCVAILSGTFDLMEIVLSQRNGFFFFPLLPVAILFFIVVIAETNRPPFDMAEAESELVAGYNLEYSAIYFAYLFLSEYCSIIVMSALWVILFFGGWLPILNSLSFVPEVIWMVLKTALICFFIILGRGIMPRYRYDQLMSLGWKIFFIFSFCFLIFLIVICFCFGFNKKQKYHNSIKLIKAYDDQHNTTPVVLYFDSKKKVDTYKASDFMSQKYPVFKDFLTAVYTKPDFKPNRTVDNMFITLYKKNQSFKDDIIEYFKRGYDVDIRDFRKLPDDIKQDIVQNEARFYMYRINELYTSYYLYHTVKAHGQLGHFIFALEDEVWIQFRYNLEDSLRALRTIRLLKNPFLKNAIINYYKKIYGINIGDFKKLPEDLKRRIITNTIERPSRDFLLFIKYCNKLELLRADGRKLINTFKMYINNTLLFQNPAYRLAICNKVANMHNRDTAMHIWKFWEAMYHFQFNEMRNLLKLASTVDKYPAGRDLTQWEELDRTISIVELAERMEDPYYLQDPAGHNVTQRKRSVKTIIKYNKTPTFGLNGQLATRSLQNETQMSTEVILSELRACNLFLSKAEETFSPQNATLPFFDTWTNKFTKNQRNLFVRMRKQILEKALHNNSRSFTQPVTPISSPLWPYYLWRVDALLDKKRTKK